MTNPTYFQALDYERMVREYPIGDDFAARMKSMSRDELHALQEKRLLNSECEIWESRDSHEHHSSYMIEVLVE